MCRVSRGIEDSWRNAKIWLKLSVCIGWGHRIAIKNDLANFFMEQEEDPLLIIYK
jgi:hypothetical protein